MSAHLDIDLDTEQVDVGFDLPTVDIGVQLPSVDIGVPGLTGPPGLTGATGVEVVHHGNDPDVERPDAPLVYWVGAAQPNNALPTDFYTSQ